PNVRAPGGPPMHMRRSAFVSAAAALLAGAALAPPSLAGDLDVPAQEKTLATGLAHYFEHMMFLGGAKYGDSFDTTFEAAGGDNNAFTTYDNTTYQDWFPKDVL